MFAALIDFFVHPSQQHDSDRLLRVRILIAVLLTLVLQESIVLVVLLTSFPPNAFYYGGGPTLVSILTSLGLLIQLRHSGDYLFCSVAAPLITLVIIIAGICASGGLQDSPVTQMIIAPVLMGFFFGGLHLACGIYLYITEKGKNAA